MPLRLGYIGWLMRTSEVSSQKFRQNLEEEIEKVVSNHEVLRVRRQEGGDFVVLSADDWRGIQETLHLQQIPGFVESLLEAAREPVEEGTRLEDLDW
jgi:antitoxin YefM